MKKGIILVLGIFLISFVSSLDCSSQNGIVSYWQFEGNTNDGVGSNNGGTFSGQYPAFKVGLGADFAGTGFSVSDSSSLILSNGFSFVFWMNNTAPPIPVVNKILLQKIGELQINLSSSNQIVAEVGGVSVTSPAISGAKFVSVVWNKASNNLSLYVDGNHVSSASLSSVSDTSNALEVGKSFTGKMDELAFYNRSLTQNEISNHYYYSNTLGQSYCYVSTYGSSESESSSTSTRFFIQGCTLPDGRELIVGGCSGDYYCESEGLPRNTLTTSGACNMTDSLKNCCPIGYTCRDTGDGNGTICHPRDVDCSEYLLADYDTEELAKTACESDDCVWREQACYDPNDDALTCSLYKSEVSCERDIWNFARESKQAKSICGVYTKGYQTVPPETCECVWSAGKCKLGFDVYDIISSDGALKFSCDLFTEVGDCVNGKRLLNLTATYDPSDFDDGKGDIWKNQQLADAGCTTGEIEVSCGKPIVKLPFFSLFSLLGVFAVLGIFYFFRK